MSLCWELMQPCGGFKSGSWQTVMLTRRKTRSKSYFNFKSELPVQSRERFNIYSFTFSLPSVKLEFTLRQLLQVEVWQLNRLEPGPFNFSYYHLSRSSCIVIIPTENTNRSTNHCSLGIFPIMQVVSVCELATAWHTLWRRGSEYARLMVQQRCWSSISSCCLTSVANSLVWAQHRGKGAASKGERCGHSTTKLIFWFVKRVTKLLIV